MKTGKLLFILLLAFFSLSIFFTEAVFAQNPTRRPLPTRRPTNINPRLTQTAGRVRACQAHEAAIKKRSVQLAQNANNMIGKFEAIETRVKEYYTNKLVPTGVTVGNIAALENTIEAKKDAVQTALTKAKTDLAAFSCTASDPKGAITKFNADMRNVKTALKEYRKSVVDLIIAIRSAKAGAHRANPSGRPTRPV